jgi:sarcosine oxidase subunit gamma
VPDSGRIGSPLPGRYGAPGASPLALRETRFAAMWNVQGVAAIPAFSDAVRANFGVEPPRAPNTIARGARWSLAWLGPRSSLALAPRSASGDPPLPAFEATRDAITAAGGALFDVSAARASWTIVGAPVATVLAKLCPLDFDPRAFPADGCAQSVLGRMNALYVREGDSFLRLSVGGPGDDDAPRLP